MGGSDDSLNPSPPDLDDGSESQDSTPGTQEYEWPATRTISVGAARTAELQADGERALNELRKGAQAHVNHVPGTDEYKVDGKSTGEVNKLCEWITQHEADDQAVAADAAATSDGLDRRRRLEEEQAQQMGTGAGERGTAPAADVKHAKLSARALPAGAQCLKNDAQ